MVDREDQLIEDGVEILRQKLPPRWLLNWENRETETVPNRRSDGILVIRSPDDGVGKLPIEAKSRINPRDVLAIADRESVIGRSGLLVMSGFLTSSTRERLREADLNWLDLTGNVRLAMPSPGLFIETEGDARRPGPRKQPARSLRGVSAGRFVRALLRAELPQSVTDLAKAAKVDTGYASRILSLLDREALVTRKPRGPVLDVNRSRVVLKWAEDAPLSKRGRMGYYLDPRGVAALVERLKQNPKLSKYAISGSLAAQSWAPVAPPRLALLYVTDALDRASEELALKRVETGANVQLIRPSDKSILDDATVGSDGLRYVSPLQATVDLLSSPGRGPVEGEALLEWMLPREEVWHG